MSEKDPDDMLVPARLADGWAYVVSLVSGEKRYLHGSAKLASVLALFEQAQKAQSLFLYFDGCRFQDDGPVECQGAVVVKDVQAIGYPTPMDLLVVDEALERINEREKAEAEAEKAESSGQDEKTAAQDEMKALAERG